MKQLFTFLIAIVFVTMGFSQDCNIGNETATVDFDAGNYSPDFLLGTKYTLTEEGTLNSINLIGNGTGDNVKMAVYDDNAGAPNNLIASSGPATVGSGEVSLAVTPVLLPAGDYWIMANFDVGGDQADTNTTNAAGNVVYYQALSFGDAMPATGSGFASFTGQDYLYFLDIDCGNTLPPEPSCNIGNETATVDFDAGNYSPDFLLGTKYTLTEEGTLNSINLIGNGTGDNVKMAVYDDNAGAPNNLIASSGPATVGSGEVSLAVTPVLLPAGDYWIMANFDAGGDQADTNTTNAAGNVVYYQALSFGDAMPATGSGFASFTGQDYLYFLDIDCGNTLPPEPSCNIGNETATVDFDAGNYSPDFLLGTKYTLTEEGTLNSINLIGNGTGDNVKMAVYDDNAGAPNNLIASSGPATVGSGEVSLAVTPVLLPAGDYWIMANFDAGGDQADTNTTNAAGNVVYYQALSFGDAMPATGSGFASFTGQDYLYFLDIDCGNTLPPEPSCNIGNETATVDFDAGNYSPDFLLGTKYTLTEEGTLNSINLIGNGTGDNVKMAVYDDNAGAPNNLIASSGPATVGSGEVSLAVTPVLLPAGDYWIMANFDAGGDQADTNTTNAAGNVVYYQALSFGDAMPATGSGFASFTGQDYLYFLDIDCGNTLPPEPSCNIGNETATVDFDAGNYSPDFLLGTKYTLTEEGTLNSINLIGNGTGDNVKMAVYDDNAGAPNNLIASSGPATVGSGEVSLAVTPVLLPAGDYWIMANFDAGGDQADTNTTNAAGNVVYYQALSFGDAMPATGSGFASFTGQDYLYFLDIDCGNTLPPEPSCNIGNETATVDFDAGNYSPDFLLGTKYTLTEEGTLNSINLIGNGTGDNVKMAVYDDNAGAPNNLIASSGPATVGSGEVSLAVTPVLLPAGDYWIMANFDAGGDQADTNTTNAAGNVVYYQALSFGDAMPATGSGFASFTGQDYLYFLDIDCGNTLSVEDITLTNRLKLYPNPSTNVINISGSIATEKYMIFNVLGKNVLKGTIQPNEPINIQNLKKGLYFIQFEGGTSLKFIKK